MNKCRINLHADPAPGRLTLRPPLTLLMFLLSRLDKQRKSLPNTKPNTRTPTQDVHECHTESRKQTDPTWPSLSASASASATLPLGQCIFEFCGTLEFNYYARNKHGAYFSGTALAQPLARPGNFLYPLWAN